MNRRQALFDAEPRNARVDVYPPLRRGRFNLVGRERIRGFQFCAMHLGLPLQVGIFVHFVRPDGSVQLEATCDRDDFLAVGHAVRANDARHGDAFGLAKIFIGEFDAAAGTRLCSAALYGGIFLTTARCRAKARRYDFLSALRADVDIFAQRNFQCFENVLFVETKALSIGNVPDVGAKFAIGPEKIADRSQQLLDVIVLLDELGDVAGGTRGGNVRQRLRRLGIEPHAWNVLRQYGNERKPEALVKIRDELVARHLFQLAVVLEALLERQMPVHVVGIPPGVLQALPEEPRLANAANFMPARYDAFLAILPDQFAQCVDQFGLCIFEAFVVRTEVEHGVRSSAILLARCDAAVAQPFRSEAFPIRCSRVRRRKNLRPEGLSYSIAVGRRDGARNARRRFSCAIQVHSASQRTFHQNPRSCCDSSRRRRDANCALPFHAKPGAGARSAFSSAAAAAASALPETPPGEIPPCRAASSSARGSPRADATLLLRATGHSSTGELV